MKLSEAKERRNSVLPQYCRIDCVDFLEEQMLEAMLNGAIAFVSGQTGLTEEDMDQYEDLTIAVFMLVADMYDTRAYTLEGSNITINPAAAAIINQYCRILL